MACKTRDLLNTLRRTSVVLLRSYYSGQGANEELRIPVPWGHLAAKVWGPENAGTRMLAIHGQLDNAGSFDTLAPLLAPASVRLVCLELADHGLSSRSPPGLLSVDYLMLAYQVKLTIDYLGWDKVTILGHSMGYMAGLFWSIMHPKNVERIISLDVIKPPPLVEAEFSARLTEVLTKVQQASDKSEILKNGGTKGMTYVEARTKMIKACQGVSTLQEKDADVLLIRGLRRIEEEQDLFEYTWDPRAALRLFLLTDGQFQSVIKAIQCPLLLIRADQGLRWPFDTEDVERSYCELYRRSNPAHFKLVNIAGRHHVHLTHPETVAPHILQFIDNDEQGRSVPTRSANNVYANTTV